jgi:hypothetical protein
MLDCGKLDPVLTHQGALQTKSEWSTPILVTNELQACIAHALCL